MFISIVEDDRPSGKDLNTHVIPFTATRWKDLGEVLLRPDLAENELKIIEANYPHDVKERCKQMLNKWRDTDKDANWKQLIDALKHPSVELNYLANRIKKTLQTKGETIMTQCIIIIMFDASYVGYSYL